MASSRSRIGMVTAALGLGFATLASQIGVSTSSAEFASPYRPFAASSYWNAPVPENAPAHPNAAGILNYLQTAPSAQGGCIRLAGAGSSPWGQPIYWAKDGDPTYSIKQTQYAIPPELATMRIPRGAKPAPTSDAAMTVYDLERGYVVAMWHAVYNATTDSWSAGGAQVTYLNSNGLDSRIGGSDDSRNTGTMRGNNGGVTAVRYDEVAAGSLNHVLKIAAGPEVSTLAVAPLTRSDGGSTDPNAPAQGTRMRIKPSVNLDAFNLSPQARVIANAMQKYGVYIGDSGGVTALKLENTTAEGRGQLWTLPSTALCSLPLSEKLWDVLPSGYDPSK